MRRTMFVLLPFLAACYTYAPVDPAGISPGMGVRARVSAAAGERIAPLLGSTQARLLDGTVVEASSDTMILEVPTVVRAEIGPSVQTLRQRVSLGRADVLEMESRKLDSFRTRVLVGGVAAIVISTAVRALKGEPGKDKLPGDGATELIIPLFSRWY